MTGNSIADSIPKLSRFYVPGERGYELESYMLENKITHIGDYAELENWYKQTNYQRSRAIEMPSPERTARSLAILRLADINQLLDWHKAESTIGYFLPLWATEVKGMRDKIKLSDIEYNHFSRNIGKFTPKYSEFTHNTYSHNIPPYFIYDLNFDGMTFHHSWDKNLFHHSMTKPISGLFASSPS